MRKDHEAAIRRRIEESARVKLALLEDAHVKTIARVADAMVKALRAGRQVIFFGNGGSAADAQHLASELVGRYYFNRPALPSLALASNTSCLTSIGNDYGYEYTFSRQIEAHGVKGDVAMGLSTSGNSPNVIEALRVAKKRDMVTVGMAGARGGKMAPFCDHFIRIPSTETPRIQEGHMLIGHTVCEIVEDEIFGHLKAKS